MDHLVNIIGPVSASPQLRDFYETVNKELFNKTTSTLEKLLLLDYKSKCHWLAPSDTRSALTFITSLTGLTFPLTATLSLSRFKHNPNHYLLTWSIPSDGSFSVHLTKAHEELLDECAKSKPLTPVRIDTLNYKKPEEVLAKAKDVLIEQGFPGVAEELEKEFLTLRESDLPSRTRIRRIAIMQKYVHMDFFHKCDHCEEVIPEDQWPGHKQECGLED